VKEFNQLGSFRSEGAKRANSLSFVGEVKAMELFNRKVKIKKESFVFPYS